MTASKKNQDAFYYLIGLCAIGFYCTVIYQNAYNIPKWDDFPEILQFLDRWLSADTLYEKYRAFISQTNEHILLVNHFIVLLQYYLIGHLNFSWLIYIGNLFYIGSALALWIFFKDQPERAFCFAIIMLCGTSFYVYDSTLWAMTAISNQAVIFFSLLAIYAATQNKKNILSVMLFSTLAIFSQSNGLVILFVIGAYYFSISEQLKLKQWLLFTAVIIGLYAYWFSPVHQDKQSLLIAFQQLPLSHYLLTPTIFFSYFGGSVFTQVSAFSMIMSAVIGLAIFVTVTVQIKHHLFSKSALLILGFLLISILSIAVYRGIFIGPQVAFISRYKMYGAYFLMMGVLLSPYAILQLQKSMAWKTCILLISAFYFVWSFPANLPQAKLIDTDLYESMQKWVEDGDFRHERGFFIKNSDAYLFAALKNKTYNPLVLLANETIISDVKTIAACPNQQGQIISTTTDFSILHKNPNAAAIKIITRFDADMPLTVTLCSAEHIYQFEIRSMTNHPSSYFIDRDAIAPDSYEVWLEQAGKYYRLENPFINKAAAR